MRLTIQPLIRLSAPTLIGVVLGGCADLAKTPVSPSAAITNTAGTQAAMPPAPQLVVANHAAAGSLADISGKWNVSGVVQLTVPTWVAVFVLGIEPEGPVTHIRCGFSGTMDLVQTGPSFSGTQDRDPNVCETAGGQHYEDPKTTTLVVDGRIHGRSLEFTIEDGPVSCPQHGVISEVQDDGQAHRLAGTARCIVPGHPKSEATPPFDLNPPPAGTSKALSWQAWR